jgi:hypothetical protein
MAELFRGHFHSCRRLSELIEFIHELLKLPDFIGFGADCVGAHGSLVALRVSVFTHE